MVTSNSKIQSTSNIETPGSAVVFSDAQNESGMVIREILRSLGLPQALVTNDINTVIKQVETFKAGLIVIEDSALSPASLNMRYLLKSPICSLTPTIAILNESSKPDSPALATLCRPMIIYKPLSPGRFANGFKALQKVWGQGVFLVVRKVVECFRDGKRDNALNLLTQLAKNVKAQPVIAPALSNLMRQSNNIKVAEKLLLATLKSSPRDLGVILSLTDLYLCTAMPNTAKRLLRGYENANGKTLATAFDYLQASFMLSDLSASIEIAMDLQSREILKKEVRDIVVKLLYTEGRVSELVHLSGSEAIIHKIADAWNRNLNAQQSNSTGTPSGQAQQAS